MPRPSTKRQMIDLAVKEFSALVSMIEKLPPVENRPTGSEDEWAGEDFIAHLLEWQNMFFGWYTSGCRGETPAVPAPGFKWNQLPALNLEIYRKFQGRPIKELFAALAESHQKLIELIEWLPEEDLFAPGLFAWQKNNTLAAYIVSVGSSHYLWARKEIRKSQSIC